MVYLNRLSSVYIIDDDEEIRISLGILLKTMDLASESFSGAADFLEHLVRLQPGPILLDVRMPEIDGLSLMQSLANQNVNWPTIIMTGHGDVPMAVKAMKLGAIEFLEKPFSPASLGAALDRAYGLLEEVDRSTAERDEARDCLACLTKREMEIVSGIVRGLPNKANAHALGLSVRTIEMHRRNAMQKLGLRSIADLVRLMTNAQLKR